MQVTEQILEPQPHSAAQAEAPRPDTNGPTAQDVIKPLEEEQPEFDFWADLRESMPPWISEVLGFALITFGVLSFISLYIAVDALVAVAWADMLTALFGDGALLVAGALFIFGILLWLPKAGVRVNFSAARMLALEIIFLAVLAILHLSHSDVELRALARAGEGGGLIGWGLSYQVFWVMGRPAALAFFAALIIVCVVILIGLQRRHIAATLARFGQKMQAFSADALPAASAAAPDETENLYMQLAGSPSYRRQIMHIRPKRASLPTEAPASQPATKSENGSARIRPASQDAPSLASPADAPAASETAPLAESTAAAIEERQSEQAPSTAQEPAPPANSASPGLWWDSLPSLDCLTSAELVMPPEEETQHNARLIQNTLLEFDLETTVIDVQVGPTVTRYALLPHKEDGSDRIRMSKIASYARDLALALAAKRLRMETPVPGTNFMGIEVPNKEPGLVALRNVLESEGYQEDTRRRRAPLLIPLGRDVAGAPISIDLSQLPHLLIAGATGTGKSVCMAAIATALLMQYSPEQLRLVMLDPKMVELSRFNGIPHLLGPVEIEHERIIGVLRWCTQEMERRYKLLEQQATRNIKMYNETQLALGTAGSPLPYIVILIDELGDLMLVNPEETERAITRLEQMARAVGMHLVIATQRPSVNVITGLIKANLPARIAFSVTSGSDSRVIIDRAGAEDLLGRGDMLFLSADAAAPLRVQGCFVAEADVRTIVAHWKDEKEKHGAASAPAAPWANSLQRRQFLQETDPMLEEVLELLLDSGEASASLIQRRLGLGYPRAGRIMDLLQGLGIIGEELGGGRSRAVIIPPGPDPLAYVMKRHKQNNGNG